MKAVLMLLIVSLLLMFSAGCKSEGGQSEDMDTGNNTQVNLPDYSIVSEEDVSFANVKRLTFRVVVPADTSADEMLTVAEEIVGEKKSEKVNAIGFFFYYEGEDTQSVASATVDWAPDGDWSKADTVKAGDYSKHEFSEMK